MKKSLISLILLNVLLVNCIADSMMVATMSITPTPIPEKQCITDAEEIVVNDTPASSCTHITAKNQIKLTPGFSFKASNKVDFTGKIDQGLLFPPTHGLTKNSDGTLSDGGSGFAVGSIPYEYSVSSSGAAVYTIPIECPQGINGMQPNISFVYNSQSRDGIMGWGWSIGGLSAITRVNKCQYFDGFTSSFEFSSNDALALDGMRLIKIAETADSVEYRTEQDNYSRIVGYDIQSRGPKYFKVYTKDGKILTYGDVEGKAENYYPIRKRGSAIDGLSWSLTEICDLNGNYISYKNVADVGNTGLGVLFFSNQRIDKITYGKNKNGGGVASTVYFEYEKSPYTDVKYINGGNVKRSLRLKCVKIYNNGTLWAQYPISYNDEDNKNKVECIGLEKGNAKIRSTTFEWNKSSYHVNDIRNPSLSWDSIDNITFGDYDGNGVTDRAFISDGGDFEIGVGLTGSVVYSEKGSNICSFTFFDVDFDGVQEIIVGRRVSSDKVEHSVGKWNGKEFVWRGMSYYSNNWKVPSSQKFSDVSYQTWFGTRVTEMCGDFWGNGTIQFIPVTNSNATISGVGYNRVRYTNNHICSVNNGCVPKTDGVGLNVGEKLFVADFNGNGKSDILVVSQSNTAVVYEEENGTFVRIFSRDDLEFCAADNIYIGDFNGDGNADLLIRKRGEQAGTTLVYLSTGTTLVERSSDYIPTNWMSTGWPYVTDFNSDGMDDIVICNSSYITMYKSTHDGFQSVFSRENDFVEKSKKIYNAAEYYYDVSYFVTQRYAPIVSYGYFFRNSALRKSFITYGAGLMSLADNSFFDKIIAIRDGMSSVLYLNYDNIERNEGNTIVGGKAWCVPLPCRDIVTGVQQDSHSQRSIEIDYKYGNVLYDNASKRFLGFETFTEIDSRNNKKITSSYSIKNGILQLNSRVENVNDCAVRTSNYEYNTISRYAKKIYSIYPSKLTEIDGLTGNKQTVTYSGYDQYGNPAKRITVRGGLTITDELYYSKAGSWCQSKISHIKTTRTYMGKSESTVHYLSYDKKGNLTSDYDEFIDKKYSDYDVFGNPQTITYSADGVKRVERYTYTSSGRYAKTKTNILGEPTTYSWNETTGRLTSETDAYGRKTSYRYNGLGELEETIYPDGNRHISALRWADNGNSYGAKYYSFEQTSGSSPVYKWFASDGREVCKQYYGLNNKLVSVFKEYYSDGMLRRVSKPTFSTSAELWAEEYFYDMYERPVSILKTDGQTDINYSGSGIITTTPNSTVIKNLSPEGWVDMVATNYKMVKYTYYPSGRLKTAMPDGGPAIYFEYDKQGNRTKIVDPDGGTVKTTYNTFGELSEYKRQQIDGAWISTKYTYSPTGLLKSSNRNGVQTDYVYNSRNLLISKSVLGGHIQEYEYDDFDRVVKVTDKIEDKTFIRKETYDFYGRPKQEVFPSGYYIKNRYDDNGYLTSVSDQYDNEIYNLLTANASGLTLTESRGGKVTTYKYDDSDRLISKSCQNYINHTYRFNDKGNLSSYTNNNNCYSYNYDYDSQNRLTGWYVFRCYGGGPIQVSNLKYDESNNIIKKSDFGNCDLLYENEDHHHAISSINGTPNIIPKSDQTITYTDFGKISTIEEGDKSYEVTYNVNDSRIKSLYRDNSGISTRYYIGDYEELTDALGNITKYHYLCGGAVMVESGGRQELRYNYTDRLGSVVATVDATGKKILERYAYDPWGNRLNPDNWTERDKRTTLLNNRGFTGHEHLDQFGLINMNGRVYDPLLGTFLSVDPIVQAPDNWLNYNRYLYCYGNPLSYTDPSGYESTSGWNNLIDVDVQPYTSNYDIPGTVNPNTYFQEIPTWWNHNSNTNYYGVKTGPGFIQIMPENSGTSTKCTLDNGCEYHLFAPKERVTSVTMITNVNQLNPAMTVSSAPTASNSALQSVANTISALNVTAGTFEYAGSKIASGVSKYYTEGVSLFNKNNLRVRVPLLIGNIFPKVGTVKQIGKFANRLGMYTGIAGVGLTAVDGYTNGWQKHHTADISITSGFIVAGAIFSGPYVVIAGCVYLVTDIGLQISTGKSLTENLFD